MLSPAKAPIQTYPLHPCGERPLRIESGRFETHTAQRDLQILDRRLHVWRGSARKLGAARAILS